MRKKRFAQSVSRRLTLSFVAIMILTLAVSIGWNYYSTRQAILDREETSARNCASVLSGLLDHYGADSLQNRSDREIYERMRHATRNYCLGFQETFLAVYRHDPESDSWKSLLEVASDEETDRYLRTHEGTEVSSVDVADMFKNGQLKSDIDGAYRFVQRNDVYWFIPYRNQDDSDYAMICIQSNIRTEFGLIMRDFLMDILFPVAAMTVSFLILLFLVKHRMIRPIKAISDSMKRFAADSRQKPKPLNIRSGDEIGEIADSFEKMTEEISTYVNNIEHLTRERVEHNVQMDVARRIQNGLVPEQFSLEDEGLTIRALTRPAKGVGGDFYDCFRREDNSVCFFMGDVSGKGITAAIFMAVAKTMIREKLLAALSPAEALNQTNDELYAQNPEGLFVTVFAAVFHQETGELRYANAGHTFPILLKEEPEYLIPDSGTALGLFEDADILDEKTELGPGEGILLYTDGVTEAVNPRNEFFGMKRLLEASRKVPKEEGAEDDVIIRVSRSVGSFCEGNEPFDDMATLVLERKNSRTAGRRKPIPVAVSSFEEIKKAVFATAGDTPETRKALLACDEALANIVHYSGAKNLDFSCEKQNGELWVVLADDGIPFDPTAAAAEEKEFDMLDSGGMGLNIIRQTASSFHYRREDDRNELSMCFSLDPESAGKAD